MAIHDRIRKFGTRVPGQDYVSRPGAYVILRNQHGQVAVVRTPIGVFLPGGGQRHLEAPEEAAIRETREECGFHIEITGHVGVADQYVHSRPEDRFFVKHSAFLSAALVDSAPSSEPDHELQWFSESEAERVLSHESHRWALAEERRITRP
jgi:8-oxo-dGTP diphosphatase